MEKVHDDTTPISTPKLETTNSATALFVVGTPPRISSPKYPRSPTSRTTPVRSTSSPRSRPTESSKSNSRPTHHRTTKPKPKPKSDNKPIAQSMPLAFPAGTNFLFNAPSSDTSVTTTNRKSTIRAIQVLPTDVLILVVQSIEPKRHHRILKHLSLVSQVLNKAIAPILYHRIRLFNLKEVYDFALHFRHPTSVTSLEMFLTPDPRNLGWSPPATSWSEQLVERLKKMERLMALTIKRGSNGAVLDSIIHQSNDPSFLPALQRLSFGYWHQLTCLAAGRSLMSYGLAFDIRDLSDYKSLDRTLIALKLSSKSILELKLTVTFTDRFQAHVDEVNDCRGKIVSNIVQHFPNLHTLILRIQSQKKTVAKQPDVTDILTMIPQKMTHLNYLELSDLRSPQYPAEATLKVANTLSTEDGLCPRLEFLSLDGLLWKRAPASPISLDISRLSLKEQGESITSQDPPNKAKSSITLPAVTWTPRPNNPRGLTWWAERAPELHIASRAHTVFILREWMLKYWDSTLVPTDDSRLDRAVPNR
ncbi:hypothetical protein RSOLAG22IIIB_13133 [Rhizoctonia solani]|uniref:F-box domain-containing protein n=1 Tax=Rhizoctonia solani TaxID=456999 RepID=A0A0K6GIR8_9AGAM|nr:unnamed protein product [Rhizoctonia solani]CUA78425.1 hypothetical protein RSOLAG22IIIB_13133 [Rhizoctonia solani]